MLIDGEWDEQPLSDTKVNLGAFVLPNWKNAGPHVVINATDSAFALNAKLDKKKRALAVDYLDLFIRDGVAKEMYEKGFSPSVKFDASSTSLSQLKKEIVAAVNGTKMGFFLDNAVAGLLDPITKTTQEIMLLKHGPKETWDQIDAAYEKLKAEAK